MCGACLSIRVFRCVARLSQCLSVPLSVLKKDILIYLCNWIWAGWLAGPLTWMSSGSYCQSVSFTQSPHQREHSVGAQNYLPAKDKMPTLLTEQDTHIPCGPPALSSRFKPDFISNTWASADWAEVSVQDGGGGKNNISPPISLTWFSLMFMPHVQFMKTEGRVEREWGGDTGNGIPEAQDTCVILAVTQYDIFLLTPPPSRAYLMPLYGTDTQFPIWIFNLIDYHNHNQTKY